MPDAVEGRSTVALGSHTAMRRTRAWSLAAMFGAWLVTLASAQELPRVRENPFEDIPPDSPVYDAIERLVKAGIMEGYPDGTFKGARVVTRYDLALAVARTSARVEELVAQGRTISPEEQALIDNLNRVVGSELRLLGVRATGLERRILAIEAKEQEIEDKKSNISIQGFYRIEDNYVFRPIDFSDYLFVREVNPFFRVRDRGLTPLKQDVFLRFAGHPVVEGVPSSAIDAFAELRAVLVGNAPLHLGFNFSRPPVAGDIVDDFATSVEDEAHVFINRAHFHGRTKNLFFRAFTNESATDLTDPNVLFTVDTLAPFSGVEANGSIKKFTYFGSALKDIRLRSATGVDPRDITRFAPERTETSDIYTFRLTWEPNKGEPGRVGKEVLLGGTYVEHAFRYDVPFDRNRVIAYDVRVTNQRLGRFDNVLTALFSAGRGNVVDRAFKFDSIYQKRGFLAHLKLYHFGPKFSADVAQDQFIDTDVIFNFRRAATPGLVGPSTRGERLFRLQLKNDWQGSRLKGIQNLILASVWEIKAWGRDDDNILLNDEEHASRFIVQAFADITRRWHLELTSEVIKPLRIDHLRRNVPDPTVLGILFNGLRSEWRIQPNLSFVNELEVKDDLDSLDTRGRSFKMVRHNETLAWQAHRRFFVKGTKEDISSSDLQLNGLPVFPINGRRIERLIAEFNWVPIDGFSIKELWVNQETENSGLRAPSFGRGFIPVEDNNTNIFVTELGFNFTPALKTRYIYANQNTNLYRTGLPPLFLADIDIQNHFGEVVYTPSVGTEVRLTYGYEFENPNDPLDNGPAKFFTTERIVQLRAQTDF